MRRWFFRLILLLVVAGLVGAAIWALRPQPVPVDLARVERADIAQWIEEDGIVRVRDVYTVSAPMGGRVRRSPVHVGDTVVQGRTVVAQIEPQEPTLMDARTRAEAQAAVSSAQASLDLASVQVQRAEAERSFASSELERIDSLVERGVMPATRREEAALRANLADAAASSAQAEVAVRERELERTKAHLLEPKANGVPPIDPSLCCVTITAPASGRVLRIVQESEMVVQAGAPLVEIGDPHDLEVVVDLLTTEAVTLPAETAVEIVGWGGADLAARLERVEPTAFTKVSALGIEEQRVTTVVAIEAPPESYASLGHGYRVTVRLLRWEGPDRLSVPVSALFRRGNAWAVFRDDAGTASLVLVDIGRMNDERAELLSGLDEGDRVVAFPSDRIADSTPIAPRQEIEASEVGEESEESGESEALL